MGGISEDVKRLRIWDSYPFIFGFSWPITFVLLWRKLPCVLFSFKRVIICHGIADNTARLSDFKLSKKLLWFMKYDIFKIFNSKFKKVWIWLLSKCKDFLIIFLNIMTRKSLHIYSFCPHYLSNFKETLPAPLVMLKSIVSIIKEKKCCLDVIVYIWGKTILRQYIRVVIYSCGLHICLLIFRFALTNLTWSIHISLWWV